MLPRILSYVALLAGVSLAESLAAPALRHHPRRQATAAPLVTEIVYIKTHATGSSTLTNIFHRFCSSYNLSCFVPSYYAGAMAGRQLLREILHMKNERNLSWNVWPNHATLEKDLFDQLIPNNTKVSIFRNPLDRTVSSWAHFPKEMRDNIDLLRNNKLPKELCGPEGKRMSRQVPIDSVHDLDFVIVTEHMNLGLVMMKRKFGWKLRDIVYASLKETHEADESKAILRNMLTQPVRAMNAATQKVRGFCISGDEEAVYFQAAERFFGEWRALGANQQREVQDDLIQFEGLLAAVGRCCEEKPTDQYCAELAQDNLEWAAGGAPETDHDEGCRKLLPPY